MLIKVSFLAVCGGTASGKTSVCMKIQEEFQRDGKVVVCEFFSQFLPSWIICSPYFQQLLSQDSFYKNLTTEQKANVSQYNFDHPDAIDWQLNEQVTWNAIFSSFLLIILSL